MKKMVVVVNPMAANGALGKRWPEVHKVLARELGAFETATTQASRDATRLTREALGAGADVVVAIGGDGTTHEVVNGFFDGKRAVRPEAALGLVPFGTGGDFRKTVGLGLDLTAAAAAIKAGKTKLIDVGHLAYTATGGGRAETLFANIASFGIGGLVDQLVNTSSKIWGGKVSFILATLRAGVRYKNQRVRMVFDGKEDDFVEAIVNNVAVANGRFFGGGMFIAPKAELDDGLFDVVIVGDMTTWDFIVRGRHLYRGTHLDLDKVSWRRATTVDARPTQDGQEVLLDVDGEAPGRLPATFTLLPHALSLIVPDGQT
jgi:YegS/Rv2252/BmrU family lipid kinase